MGRSEQSQNFFLYPGVSSLRVLDQLTDIVNRPWDCAFLTHKDETDGGWGDRQIHKQDVVGLGAGEERRRSQVLLELLERTPTVLIPLKALGLAECLEKGKTTLHRFGDEPTKSDYVAHQMFHLNRGPRWGEIQDSSDFLRISFNSSLRDDEAQECAR